MNKKLIYNAGRPIQDWSAARHQVLRVTLLDNQCVELDSDIADALMKEFPYVKEISTSITTISDAKSKPLGNRIETEWLEREAESQVHTNGIANELIKDLPKGLVDAPHFCSMCSSDGVRFEAKSKHGLNIHIRARHEKGA